MSNLRRQTRNIHQKGSYVYGTVENLILGLATVRLATNGARLTNLPVVGGAVAIGQRVAIDYSAGVPPVVRPVAEEQQPTVGYELPEGPEVIANKRRDHSCRLMLTSNVTITQGVWTTISWHEAAYQTDQFWTSGTDITLPFDGVYIFLADLSWSASHDHWDEIHTPDDINGDGFYWNPTAYHEPLQVEFTSTTSGSFGYYQDFPVDSVPTVGKMMQAMCTHYGAADEIVQLKVSQYTKLSTMDLVPVSEGGGRISPRLTIQWMGARE